MFDKKSLGKKIKELRKNKGFTQELLSEIIGVDSKHLSRIECGVNQPSLDLINKISNALKIEPYVFFDTIQDRTKAELINDINIILDNTQEDKVKLFYKILVDIIS